MSVINFSNWFSEFIDVGGTGLTSDPIWVISPDGSNVLQTENSAPAFYCSDFEASGAALEGRIQVETTLDDDFIGFALGFQ